jgi:hypothetical protein
MNTWRARMTSGRLGDIVDFGVPNSRTSAPPENTFSPPVSTTALTSVSANARSSPATMPQRSA